MLKHVVVPEGCYGKDKNCYTSIYMLIQLLTFCYVMNSIFIYYFTLVYDNSEILNPYSSWN